ncbi:MAG: hypothetical protein ABSF38_13280 [Verrucomicrobiota bacterium]|jgi:hypothetical protein
MEQPHQTDVGKIIVEAACSPDSKDLAAKLIDLDLDILTNTGVLIEMPYLKTFMAVFKTYATIRDRLFLQKVGRFILGCPRFTEAEREEFARNHLNDPKEAKRLSDTVVLILDKLDDLEKPYMVAKVFAALVERKIDLETFRRLLSAIDIGFLEDLEALSQDRDAGLKTGIMRSLLRTGLVEIAEERDPMKVGQLLPKSLGLAYKTNELGRLFIACLNSPTTQKSR